MIEENQKNKVICNWCGNLTIIIWVHGHGQCKICGTNIDECCKGEVCELPENLEKDKENVSKTVNNK